MAEQPRDESERTPLLDSLHGIVPTNADRGLGDSECLSQAASSSTPSSDTFDYGIFSAMMLMGMVKPLCFDLILPFINQMIVDNGIVRDPSKVGQYSGPIQSAFSAMNLLVIMPWAKISDLHGRRPVVLIGTLGMALCITTFGLCKSYWLLFTVMCFGGVFAGSRSTMKVMIAELYPIKVHQMTLYSANQVAFRVAQMVGDGLGGYLSHPERRWALFDTEFWRRNPYWLPCLTAGCFATLCFIVAYVALPESPQFRRPEKSVIGVPVNRLATPESPTANLSLIELQVIFTPRVWSVCISMVLGVFIAEGISILYPLLAFTPVELGGLGYTEAQIGLRLSIRSALFVASMVLAAPIQNYLGPLRTYQIALSFCPLALAMLPIMSALIKAGDSSLAFNASSVVFFLSWATAGLLWPSSDIVVVESASSPEYLATVYGIVQTAEWIAMAIAPIIVSNLWVLSVKYHAFGGSLVYVILIAISIAAAGQSFTIPQISHQR